MKPILWPLGITVAFVAQMLVPQGASVQAWSEVPESRGYDAPVASAPMPLAEPLSSASTSVADGELLAEYPVPGSPHAISVESPGRVWFTMPAQNLIGRLVVTSTVDYHVDTYAVPTAGSYPYDLAYAGDVVWFTEQQGNKIGRLDPSSGTIIEFPIGTASSVPTGIDVLTGTPTYVWFTERSGNKLGRLVFTNPSTWTLAEYALPAGYSGAALEDVSIRDAATVWFTAPAIGYIGRYDLGVGFTMRTDSRVTQPWSIEVAAGGLPVWFTDRSGNQVGAYIPTTISDFRMYAFPVSGSAPYGLVLMGEKSGARRKRGSG